MAAGVDVKPAAARVAGQSRQALLPVRRSEQEYRRELLGGPAEWAVGQS